MDCFQILPDLSVKNGADFIPCLILLCGGAGWGKGTRERKPVKPGALGLAGPVGLDLSRNQARCLLRKPCGGRQGVSEGAAQGLPLVGMFGEPCVWEWGLLILGCLRAPRAGVRAG